ncbi:MAG TPA: FG-GAP-like repeat-containing protein [Gemmataceae bacterium]|nr:FG-GAP-like repeat-containing protein [Gemmataceae bacterium]
MSTLRRYWLPLTFLLLVLAVGGIVTVALSRRSALPPRGSAEYVEYQRAFDVGVAALEAGQDKLARAKLDLAIQMVPGEPAAWANRGLLDLRNNILDRATADLQHAHALAPDNGAIEALLGILAEKQGKLAVAVAHLRKAVERNPRNLRAIFALADAVSKEGGPASDAEYQRLMEQILKVQPNNLPVLMERVAAAHRSKDKAAFKDTLDHFDRLAPGWTTESREMLAELHHAVANDPGEVTLKIQRLGNDLRGERGYVRDSSAIRPLRAAATGSAIPTFIRMQQPLPTPAPADQELTFKVEPLPDAGKNRWQALTLLWTLDIEAREALLRSATEGGIDARQGDIFKAAIYVADATNARRVDGNSPALAFPGGAKKIAPSSVGMLAFDWNNDLRMDLLLAGAAGLKFWEQHPNGSFVDVNGKSGLAADILTGDYFGAWAADIEMDGDLDIIVARRAGPPLLLRNNRDGTFKAMEIFPTVDSARAFVWADLDSDGAPDAALLDAKGKLHIFANERAGRFSARAVPDSIGTFLAVIATDVNDDGALDLVALRSDGVLVAIDADLKVTELTTRGALPDGRGSFTLLAADLDNNGALDFLIVGERDTHIVLADGDGKFSALPAPVSMRVSAVADLTKDGRLDLVGLSPDGEPMRALNQGKKPYRWQVVRPLANLNPKVADDRLNSFTLGGEVEVRAGSLAQKQAIQSPVLHFGLGEQPGADLVRIVWPNGVPQWEFDVPADTQVAAVQRLSGSCPFLFTFDGEGIRFAGDFMWGTPLGMYVNGQNAGDFPQTTEWLKIPGPHLRPRGGYYDVRVHANLWETDYFDQLALIVVDHPLDTEIFVDERFFLKPTPPKLHVTGAVKPVAKAWDHLGKDATDEVSAIDGRYLDRCPRGRFQGVTHDHWVELDLGDDAPRDGPLLLIARGWLHPTNSSINVALAQGKHDLPSPLSVEVPDNNGGWKPTGPPIGFPAGKDKTMLIRLDGLDGKAVSRRIRLRTSMEIYWDFLGYAVELDAKLAKQQRPEMASAELRYRGILAMSQKNASSPEVPHYDKVIHGPQAWRDLTGYYTRFGDVRELLAKVDDRYVIANAGDEIALRFPAPSDPPAGWKRDFIWECDGWTRDGDFNTRFGNSVHPLPAHGVNVDLRPPGKLQDDPVYRRFPGDWRTYHTRYVSGDEFARGLWWKR